MYFFVCYPLLSDQTARKIIFLPKHRKDPILIKYPKPRTYINNLVVYIPDNDIRFT